MNTINPQLKKYLEDKMELHKVDNAIIILPTDCQQLQKLIKDTSKDVKYQIIQCNIVKKNEQYSNEKETEDLLPSVLNITVTKEELRTISRTNTDSVDRPTCIPRLIPRDLDLSKHSDSTLVKKTLHHYLQTLSKMIIQQDNKWCWAHQNFLSSLSHQIKTPLNGIATGIQILEDNIKDDFNRNILNYLFQSCIELSTYVNDIIDYYLFAQNKVEFKYSKHNIRETVKFIEEVYQSQIEENKIKWTTNISSTIPNYIVTDGKRICQVLVNLIGNSLKFTFDGEIQLDFQYLSLENKLVITVLDTGPGIPNEEINNVFNAFYQVLDKWMTTQDGLGIGLSISKKIIEGLDGEIYFIENPLTIGLENKGVAIQFWIPNEINKVADKSDNKPVEKPRNKPINIRSINFKPVNSKQEKDTKQKKDTKQLYNTKGGKIEPSKIKRVLIIEDNKTNANLLKMMIQKIKNIEVDLVLNPESAISHILTDSYDLVFLDIKMPRISGYDILQELKELKNAKNINIPPIIVITALISQDVDKKLVNYPIFDIIHKPIQIEQIKKIIQ